MRFSFLVLLVVLVSCKKKQSYDQVIVLGHAGNGLGISTSIYHDNTCESVNLALSMDGCEGVEVDVQLSIDGTLWLLHNKTLNDETNVTGCINSKTDFELSGITYNSQHKEKLCRLTGLELNNFKDKFILLDLRYYNFCEEKEFDVGKMVSALLNFRQLAGSSVKIYPITNHEHWIDTLHASGFEVMFSAEDVASAKSVAETYPISSIMMKNNSMTAEDVGFFKNQQLKVVIFEVRSPKGIKDAFSKNPDFLLTDNIRETLIEKYP